MVMQSSRHPSRTFTYRGVGCQGRAARPVFTAADGQRAAPTNPAQPHVRRRAGQVGVPWSYQEPGPAARPRRPLPTAGGRRAAGRPSGQAGQRHSDRADHPRRSPSAGVADQQLPGGASGRRWAGCGPGSRSRSSSSCIARRVLTAKPPVCNHNIPRTSTHHARPKDHTPATAHNPTHHTAGQPAASPISPRSTFKPRADMFDVQVSVNLMMVLRASRTRSLARRPRSPAHSPAFASIASRSRTA